MTLKEYNNNDYAKVDGIWGKINKSIFPPAAEPFHVWVEGVVNGDCNEDVIEFLSTSEFEDNYPEYLI